MRFTEGNKGVSPEEQVLRCGSMNRCPLPLPLISPLGAGSCESDTLLFRLSGAACLAGLTPEGA